MTIAQDSTDPTGVSDDSPRGSSGAVVARERKADAAIQMKKEAHSWEEIAETLGYPTARAAIVATELALRRRLESAESAEFMRNLAGERLDALLKSVYKKATNPDSADHLLYLREARILIAQHVDTFGYAVPKKATNSSPTVAQLEQFVSGLLKFQAPEVEEENIFDAEVVSDTDEDPDALPS